MRAEPTRESVTHEWSPRAERIAPLIDGEDYYSALHAALQQARRQVYIVGWDLHSEVELLRGNRAKQSRRQGGAPTKLADILEHLVEAHQQLDVRLVIWEANPLFVFERQYMPRMRRPWNNHPRINLVWAADAPPLGSYHEKIVVIDDRVAFVGGMDLTQSRWDTHEHRIGDKRRRKPGMIPFYGKPYHDAMMLVDDEAARVLGDHCRARWRQATGESIDRPTINTPTEDADAWPARVDPLLRDRQVYLSQTEPAWGERRGVRQAESAFFEQVRRAKRFILIETQYLAAESVVGALCARLENRDGPEVVLILPYGCPGKIQAMIMDCRRDALIDRLRASDTHGRLGVYWPTLAGGDTRDVFKHSVYVHAKTMIVDDRLLRIGSANLNNRSMGLDTELDAYVEVDHDERDAVEAIRRHRHRSLSHLLGAGPEWIADAEAETGSLLAAIESLRGGQRTLQPFDHRAPEFVQKMPLDIELADPDHVIEDADAARLLKAVVKQTRLRTRLHHALSRVAGVIRRAARPTQILAVVVCALVIWQLAREVTPTSKTIPGSMVGLLGSLLASLLVVWGVSRLRRWLSYRRTHRKQTSDPQSGGS